MAPVATASHALKGYAWKLRYPGEPYVIEEGELEVWSRIANELPAEQEIPGESGPHPGQSSQGD